MRQVRGRVVGERHECLAVGCVEQDGDRPEHLLASDRIGVTDVAEHRWRVKAPDIAGNACPSGQDLSATRPGRRDGIGDLVRDCASMGGPTSVSGSHPSPQRSRLAPSVNSCANSSRTELSTKDPARRSAALPCGPKRASDHSLSGQLEIGVREHDGRVLAAHLELGAPTARRSASGDLQPCRSRACEGHEPHHGACTIASPVTEPRP